MKVGEPIPIISSLQVSTLGLPPTTCKNALARELFLPTLWQ